MNTIKLRAKNLFLALIFSSQCVLATENSKEEYLTAALQYLAEDNNLIGTHFVAVVNQDGLVSFNKYSPEQNGLDEDSKFLIASHTKAFTGTLAMILAAQNKIDLHTPIADYSQQLLTNEKLNAKRINLDQLLTHTAGFTSIEHSFKTAYLGYNDNLDLINALNTNTLVAPNNAFRYSNTGPIVAAMAIESKLQETWQNLLTAQIFSPLGMENTSATVPADVMPSIITANNGKIFLCGHFKTDKTMHASGGISSTINDLSRWLQVNIPKDSKVFNVKDVFKPLHEKQVKQNRTYFTYERTGYTLGWDVARYNEETLLTRFGTYAGYSIHVFFMPEKQLGVIAFTNQDIAFALPHVIANYAYNVALGKENTDAALELESARLRQSITKQLLDAPEQEQILAASKLPEKVPGIYKNKDNWPPMSISIENSQITVRWGGLEGVLLRDERAISHILAPFHVLYALT